MTIMMFFYFAAAFLFGFLAGLLKSSKTSRVEIPNQPREDPELERLRQEYQNFLSYDGSEQE